jgi:hypothetical protein
MRPLVLVIALAGALSAPLRAEAQPVDDPFKDYLQRSDTILFGAGNANDANAAIHTITPWPPYVGNTRIPIDGRRAVQSVEQMHRVPNPFQRQGADRSATGAGTGGQGGQGSNTNISINSSQTPMQPLSDGE